MAYIRTPIASGIHHGRQMKTSPRCLVVSLSIAFFAFNWLVYHAFQGRASTPKHSSSSSSSQRLPNPSNLPLWKQPHGEPWTVPSNHTSHQQEPSWLGNWLRWRGLDPGYDEAHSTEQLKFDVVYTWVNGSDSDLQNLRHEYQSKSPLFQLSAAGDAKTIESVTTKRFRDMDELRYSVRSVAQYASSTYRRIHILSTESRPGQAQSPYWLKTSLNGSTEGELRVVPHRALFADSADLPSFNSLAIESQMRNIPGLSDVVSWAVFAPMDSFFVFGIYPDTTRLLRMFVCSRPSHRFSSFPCHVLYDCCASFLSLRALFLLHIEASCVFVFVPGIAPKRKRKERTILLP